MMLPVETVVARIRERFGLEFALGPQGTARLVLSEGLAIDFESSGEAALFVYAVLGPAPPEDLRAEVFAAMLHAQLFGRETGSAQFGLDSSRGELLLHRYFDLRLHEADAVIEAIEDFSGVALSWAARLAEPQTITSSQTPPGEQNDAVRPVWQGGFGLKA